MGPTAAPLVQPDTDLRGRPIRVLTFTTLFPNAAQPVNGIFVENRLRQLLPTGRIEPRVVAPVPWFPSTHPCFGAWSVFAGAPDFEERHGIPVWHPRFPTIPRIGMTVAPLLLYLWTRRLVRRLAEQADFDLIDAHYFYPDGVAAALLARELNKPLVITARGTDLNLIPRFALPRKQIRWAAGRADGLVAVCQALTRPLLEMGTDPGRILVLRNGVDLDAFHPQDRDAARAGLKVSGRVLLSVGHLIERKGHHLVIDALASIPDAILLIAGTGPERAPLEERARRAGLGERVRFLGEIDHARMPGLYAAADALILASSREGWANVLLEAMACGTPVIATDVWGTREVVGAPEAGLLVKDRSAPALALAVNALLAALPDRAATRRYAEGFGWEPTTNGQIALFASILDRDARCGTRR